MTRQDMTHWRDFQRLHLGPLDHRVISICLLYPYFVIVPTHEEEGYREVSFCIVWQMALKM